METSASNEVGAMGRIKALPLRLCAKIVDICRKGKKLAQDDPRRIVHSFKVALAITSVSLLYYFDPLYNGFGDSAMWAVLTVIVIFDFYVGATLGRGLNRGLATFVAGALGFGAHSLANLSGEHGEPILLSGFIFILAAVTTFARFFPRMKARYDYGLLIFILTFCMVSVSGYRDDRLIHMARKRVLTILMGTAIALFVCICIYPAWAGDDLHREVAGNIGKLGDFLQGFGGEYLGVSLSGDDDGERRTNMQQYKDVLNSKQNQITLANFARWEPRHGKFRFRHPWNQYLKIGGLTRQCGYRIEALSNHLNSDTQLTPQVRRKIEEGCMKLSMETGMALKELATGMKNMTEPSSSANKHIANLKAAANNLTCALKGGMWQDLTLADLVPAATVALLLVDAVSCTEKIAESVQELALLANFKKAKPVITEEKIQEEQQVQQQQQQSKVLERIRTMRKCNSIRVRVTPVDFSKVETLDIEEEAELEEEEQQSKVVDKIRAMRARGAPGYHVITIDQPVVAAH